MHLPDAFIQNDIQCTCVWHLWIWTEYIMGDDLTEWVDRGKQWEIDKSGRMLETGFDSNVITAGTSSHILSEV